MFRLAVRQLAPRVPITRRYISSSSSLRSASPEWQELIGGREGVERKRKAYEGKYAAAMEAKARAEGLTVEELKRRQNVMEARKKAAEAEARALRQAPPPQDTTGPVPAGSEGAPVQGQVTRPLPSAESDTARAARSFAKPKDAKDSPVKVRVCEDSPEVSETDPEVTAAPSLHHGPLQSRSARLFGDRSALDHLSSSQGIPLGGHSYRHV